jgi:aspartyl-tRNA(Asn)/glutamyl-tRNA(Gln) amidotransferase subunit A
MKARTYVDAALERIADENGEGARTFLKVDAEGARAAADRADAARGDLPLAGMPISVKDLFDVAGQTTSAGAAQLKDAPPATEDAVAVARLRASGAALIGRTNMTEFAYSGLGINPHFGTPANPFRRAERLIPGGSSSGAAVSVADGMALAALGTDTGGSCRIPAALCGLVGFKPTARRISRAGVFPLSFSQDSVGVIARNVAGVRLLDSVLAPQRAVRPGLKGRRLLVPDSYLLDELEPSVAADFEAVLSCLAKIGFEVVKRDARRLDAIPARLAMSNIVAAEAYRVHSETLASRPEIFDPRVGRRIALGSNVDFADYLDLQEARQDWQALWAELLEDADAMVVPTVPMVAPPIAALEADDASYFAANGRMLRNPTVVNVVDGCAMSIPMHQSGGAPTGLMLMSGAGRDAALLELSELVEAVLERRVKGGEQRR